MYGEMLRCEPSLLQFTSRGDHLRFVFEPDGEGTAMTFTVTLEELGEGHARRGRLASMPRGARPRARG